MKENKYKLFTHLLRKEHAAIIAKYLSKSKLPMGILYWLILD